MRRLALVWLLLLLVASRPASAQMNCLTLNGTNQCAAPLRLFDATPRGVSLPVLDLTQTWNNPSVTFTGQRINITDTGSATGSLLADWQVNGVSKFGITKTGAFTTGGLLGLGTTSTSGFILNNLSPSTATTTVQISPAFRQCGTAYNSTSAASETDCFFWEVLPATVAGTTTALYKLGVSIAGGAATYPFTFSNTGDFGLATLSATGTGLFNGGLSLGVATNLVWTGRGVINSPADGEIRLRNNGDTIGSILKVDALPAYAAGWGAVSPAVVAGSTPMSGAINTGTGAATNTGTVTFGGTAWPSAPNCICSSTVAAGACSTDGTTTTVLTMTTAVAPIASSLVRWVCFSSK